MKSVWFAGPAGRLDGRTHGTGPPVLVLHPHPAHGGTMGTRFVYQICHKLAAEGYAATRFDFRGVGRSEGSYDRGDGESLDAAAVWDALSTEQPALVVGFSFGAGVAVRLATLRPVPGLVLVAPPAHVRDSTLHPAVEGAHVTAATHVIIGSADQQVDPAGAEAVRAATRGRITVLQGADHFLTPTHHERGLATVLTALAEVS